MYPTMPLPDKAYSTVISKDLSFFLICQEKSAVLKMALFSLT